ACFYRPCHQGWTCRLVTLKGVRLRALLQGSPEQLADMCAWLSEGMPAALVEQLEVADVTPPFARFDRFERLATL
ncbi:acylphosphatase, partial [Cupriavidus pinatubonensis]|uniref:acylphosphatase n=1 Tax=Cupriavidus pinatubonensis TaxID=248026 RepID=UPI0036097BB7